MSYMRTNLNSILQTICEVMIVFIFTARLNKRKLISALLIIIVLIAIIVLATAGGDDEDMAVATLSAVVKNNEQRIAYLESFGWDVSDEPIDEIPIVIPKKFDDVYAGYNQLQLSQGFDLSKYGGLEAVRYTYGVLNYPSGDNSVVADIIVYRNQIIAGDVQSTAMNGFMTGLKFPEK